MAACCMHLRCLRRWPQARAAAVVMHLAGETHAWLAMHGSTAYRLMDRPPGLRGTQCG